MKLVQCPEERDYYPYWAPTPWRDIAVGVTPSQMSTCKEYVKQSQNVVDKGYCDVSGVTNPTQPLANNYDTCVVQTGTWKMGGKWGLPAPECFEMPFNRDNHLGNNPSTYANEYNWTIPGQI